MKISAINESLIFEEQLFLENIVNEDLRDAARKAMQVGGNLLNKINAQGYKIGPKVSKFLNSPYGKIALAVGLNAAAMGVADGSEFLQNIGGDYDTAVDAMSDLASDNQEIADTIENNIDGVSSEGGEGEGGGGEGEMPDTTMISKQAQAASEMATDKPGHGGVAQARTSAMANLRVLDQMVQNSNGTTPEEIMSGLKEDIPRFFERYDTSGEALSGYIEALISDKLGGETGEAASDSAAPETAPEAGTAEATEAAESDAGETVSLRQQYDNTLESMQDAYNHSDGMDMRVVTQDFESLNKHMGLVIDAITSSEAESWADFRSSEGGNVLSNFMTAYFDGGRIGAEGQQAFTKFVTELAKAKW